MKPVDLKGALEALQLGDLVIYPTETFYGIGVDILNAKAIEKLFSLKGRKENKPVSLLVASSQDVSELVSALSPQAKKLMEIFFPGPLTLVLPAAAHLAPRLHGETGWIGIRQSSHPVAQELVEAFGRPITTTSANPSGAESGTTEVQLEKYFGVQEGIFFLPGGDLPPSKGSTVVKVHPDRLELLREGEIVFEEINKIL